MKKIYFILLLGISLNFSCDSSCLKLQTNYYDLTSVSQQEKLSILLNSKDLKIIQKNNIKEIKQFIQSYLIGLKNPLNRNIHTSYFWNIYLALPDFVHTNEKHHGYYISKNSFSEKHRLLAYAVYRIDRSSENLMKNYTCIKKYLKKYISLNDYKTIKAADFIQETLNTYNYLEKNIPNFENKLLTFYNRYYDKNGRMKIDENLEIKERINGAYGFSAYDLSELLSQDLKLDHYSEIYGSIYLSFWMRRAHEGNLSTVHFILTDIQKLYNQ